MTDKAEHNNNEAQNARNAGPQVPPCVAVVGSAGAFNPVKEMLEAWEEGSGLAVVLMIHQSREHPKDLLGSLLQEKGFETRTVEDETPLKADTLHVCPPGRAVEVRDGALHLVEEDASARPMPIDRLLRSMAKDLGQECAAVVLSGANQDGLLGARALKEANALVLVQDPDTAEHQTMPGAVARDGLADHRVQALDVPVLVRDYFRRRAEREPGNDVRHFPQKTMDKIFGVLKKRLGQDFSQYKHNTMARRILRRMDLLQAESPEEYLERLKESETEPQLLFGDLLIGVTSFFRDPEAFEALEQAVQEKLLPRMDERESFRVWVPGCSTGEEAYSVAMVVKDALDGYGLDLNLQVYATDLDADALVVARKGLYPKSVAADIPRDKLDRRMVLHGGDYAVRKELRESLVFAEHNLLKDPPFSRMDLICCRNLLIYLDKSAQKRVLDVFQYALQPHGLLFLGSSESLEQAGRRFEVVDRKRRIFAKGGQGDAHPPLQQEPGRTSRASSSAAPAVVHEAAVGSLQQMAEQYILQTVPPTALVNQHGDVLYLHGRTGRFLEPSTGEPSHNLLAMAREGLKADLSTALNVAATSREHQTRRRIPVKTNGDSILADIEVHFVKTTEAGTRYLLVSFSESQPPVCPLDMEQEDMDPKDQRIKELEKELDSMRQSMQTVVEEYETANEELKSTNEELQSSNEELKSSNEELETAKEELQSINEEHATLNSELSSKLDELHRMQSDMNNLMAATNMATVFLDKEGKIMRFTPAIRRVLSLQESDVGRPVGEIALHLEGVDLEQTRARVLETLEPRQREVQTEEGAWLQMRAQPYRSTEDVIEGVVVTFEDVTELKHRELEARRARNLAQAIVRSIRDPLAVLDPELQVESVNQAFADLFDESEGNLEGRSLLELEESRWESPKLRRLLEEVIPEKTAVEDYPVTLPEEEGERRFLLNARMVRGEEGGPENILIVLRPAPNDGEAQQR
jgi:two-component system CheB/CheR fusion protein